MLFDSDTDNEKGTLGEKGQKVGIEDKIDKWSIGLMKSQEKYKSEAKKMGSSWKEKNGTLKDWNRDKVNMMEEEWKQVKVNQMSEANKMT